MTNKGLKNHFTGHVAIIDEILEAAVPLFEKHKKLITVEDFPTDFILVHVLERFIKCLKSIKTLVADDPHIHDHSIGLISRNLMTDFITIGYTLFFSEEKKDADHLLYSMCHEDWHKFKNSIQLLVDSGIVDEMEKSRIHTYISSDEVIKKIEKFGKNNKVKEFPKTTAIIRKFVNHKNVLNNGWAEQIRRGFEYWAFFSKYEHLGWLSYKFSVDSSRVMTENRLVEVLYNVVFVLKYCCHYLEDNVNDNRFSAVHDKLGEILFEDF